MMTYLFDKDKCKDLKKVESVIDEYNFHTFQSCYLDLTKQLKSVAKNGETSHSLLIDFLFWSLERKRNENQSQ